MVNSGRTLGLVMAVLALAGGGLPAQDAKPTTTEETIKRDQKASLRYLTLKLQKEQRLLKRGSEEEAVKLEAECLRHEAKCLERYLWYMRRDKKLTGKAKAVSAALDELKKKDPKAGLEARKKAGFKISDLVSNPLGLAAVENDSSKMESHTFSSAPAAVSVNKPSRASGLEAPDRFEGAKPPPGHEAPPEAGSAGSAGSFTDR